MSKVCILAAGKGGRLGYLTNHLSKGLLPINDKAIISWIIEKFPTDSEFVVAIGYKKETIKEYLLAAYPNLHFTFVEVDNYDGPKSGPGYSMSLCKPYLQEPFYVVTVDCIVTNDIPSLDTNWLGVSFTHRPYMFATVKFDAYNNVKHVLNKDINGYEHAYIGLAGIKQYDVFWSNLETYLHKNNDKEQEKISAFYDIEKYSEFKAIEMDWLDTGTPENYEYAVDVLGTKTVIGLPKCIDDITYYVNNRIIKLFSQPNKATLRIQRGNIEYLRDIVPKFSFQGEYVYAYEWLDAKNLYEADDINVFKDFLSWINTKLWNKPKKYPEGFSNTCAIFYRDKTLHRLNMFIDKRLPFYTHDIKINKLNCRNIYDTLQLIDWDDIFLGFPGTYHGDLNFSNILVTSNLTGNHFTLIDWRESFGDQTEFGDIYYDLAKLYAGTDVSWYKIQKNKFSISINNKHVNIFYENTPSIDQFKTVLEQWIVDHNYSLEKVKIISALSMLNMAPLHVGYVSDFLFFHGLLRLNEVLIKNE